MKQFSQLVEQSNPERKQKGVTLPNASQNLVFDKTIYNGETF